MLPKKAVIGKLITVTYLKGLCYMTMQVRASHFLGLKILFVNTS